MKDKVRVGVLGVGSLGEHHARIYSELAHADFVGVYDTDAARATAIAERLGARAFASIEELAGEIEAASVAVPTDFHYEVATQLMEGGVHLLVEKPIASTTSQAEAMVALSEKRDLVLQVGHIERFNPVMQFLESRLTHPRFIEAIRISPFPPPRPGSVPRGTEVSVVLDLMIHDLEIILHLVRSPVTDIHAVGVPVLSGSEDIANVRLCFENRCVANVTASRISRERLRKIRVFQEDAYLSLDYMNQAGMLSRKSNGSIEAVPVPLEKQDQLTAELTAFLDCVRTRSEPVVSGEHGSAALKLAAEICRRMRENPS